MNTEKSHLKNILILGGLGFIGKNLNHLLRERGHTVTVVDQRSEKYNGDCLNISLNNTTELEKTIIERDIKVLIHLACGLLPSSNNDAFEKECFDNISPSFNLMQLCAKAGVQFVLFSSGGAIYGDTDKDRCDETLPLLPKSLYGLSKVMLEEYVRFCNRTHNLDYLVIRPSNPYGKHQRVDGTQGIIAVAMGKILSGEPIEIWGDDQTIRDYIDVQDLALAVAQLIENNISNRVLNIGSGTGHSIRSILELVQIISDRRLNIIRRASRPSDVRRVVLNIDALQSLIPWQPSELKFGLTRDRCITTPMRGAEVCGAMWAWTASS